MKIKEIFQRDPATHGLVNQGQARITGERDDKTMAELRGELSTFVCEGQYAEGIQNVIHSFLDNLSRTSQKGAWISGFFGSGKSHLLKMLCHLWQDTTFQDGVTARSLVPTMPDELRSLLRELNTAGKRSGGLLAAAGALPSGTTDNVRLTILSIIFRAAGLPEQYPQARFCIWLHSQGYFDRVKQTVESAGKTFERELNNLFVSGPIAQALISCDPKFAAGEAEAKQLIKAQFPPQSSDITTAEFLRSSKDALALAGRDGRVPCTLIVLDEAQQYIGQVMDRSVLITEVAEAVSKQMDSHVMIVAAGQNALTDMALLQKLMDRFTVRVSLSDADVETVTRKVLLQKKPSAVSSVKSMLESCAGEISRQLQGTRIGERPEDKVIAVDDYPLLPVRRRFWEHCFRQIDAAGTHSQLRSQLRIIHDAIRKIADFPIGSTVPADELYEALAPEMVNAGVLLREINERIIQVGKKDGDLAKRICGLVFLIGKLPREGGSDIGVHATKEHIADLLVEKLDGDNGKLRDEVGKVLRKLSEQGTLMLVGDEYRLQTREGSEWDREYRNRQTKLANDDPGIQFRRDQLLYAETDKIIRGVRLLQGAAKESRQFAIYRDQTPPVVEGGSIPAWIRDGWSCSEKEMVEAARSAGADSPTIYAFIPRQAPDDLRRLIVEVDAAQQTLDIRGNPTTNEGQEARQSMASRRAKAQADLERLIHDIISNAKVFQGGGNELIRLSLDERVRDAANDSLVRMFPRFKEADSVAWEAVIKRARDGSDHPFQPTGHTESTEKHPVCQQILTTIGTGKTGTEIRKTLQSSPFGWPQDAIDAGLIALHRSQHITATLNGALIALGQLDQNRISRAEFRVEKAALSVQDRLLLRRLYSQIGLSCASGEEAPKASEFLRLLMDLGNSSGGSEPLPPIPALTEIEDLQRLVGNDQLLAIKGKAPYIETQMNSWLKLRDLANQRRPGWEVLQRMAKQVHDIPEAQGHLQQMDAIVKQRLLLEGSDPTVGIRNAISDLLRSTLDSLYRLQDGAFKHAMESLAANALWLKVSSNDRENILTNVGLSKPTRPDVGTDDALLATLESRPLSAIRAEIDAIPGRIQQAIEAAARLLEPQVQTIFLERTTLRSEADIDAWLGRQKEKLVQAVKKGPVLVS
jgi:hypothetical protein